MKRSISPTKNPIEPAATSPIPTNPSNTPVHPDSNPNSIELSIQLTKNLIVSDTTTSTFTNHLNTSVSTVSVPKPLDSSTTTSSRQIPSDIPNSSPSLPCLEKSPENPISISDRNCSSEPRSASPTPSIPYKEDPNLSITENQPNRTHHSSSPSATNPKSPENSQQPPPLPKLTFRDILVKNSDLGLKPPENELQEDGKPNMEPISSPTHHIEKSEDGQIQITFPGNVARNIYARWKNAVIVRANALNLDHQKLKLEHESHF